MWNKFYFQICEKHVRNRKNRNSIHVREEYGEPNKIMLIIFSFINEKTELTYYCTVDWCIGIYTNNMQYNNYSMHFFNFA